MNICYTCFDYTSVVSMASLLKAEAKVGQSDLHFYIYVDEGGESHYEKMILLAKQYGASIQMLDLNIRFPRFTRKIEP